MPIRPRRRQVLPEYRQREILLDKKADEEFAYAMRSADRRRDQQRGGRRWGPQEIAYATDQYPRVGARRLAKALGRTELAVKIAMYHFGIDSRVIPDGLAHTHMTIYEAADLKGVTKEAIRQRALKHGVLRRLGGTERLAALVCVPKKWVREQEWRPMPTVGAAQDLRAHGWLDVHQAAAYLGLTRSGFAKHVKTELVKDLVEPPVLVNEPPGAPKQLFSPRMVAALRKRLDSERQAIKDLVSIKSLAVDMEVDSSTIIARCKRWGIKIRTLTSASNSRIGYVTTEEAERLRTPIGPRRKRNT